MYTSQSPSDPMDARTSQPVWCVPVPAAADCTHDHSDAVVICSSCVQLLADLLADTVHMVPVLDDAIRRDVHFRRGPDGGKSSTGASSTPMPIDVRASDARQRLELAVTRALMGLSDAAEALHEVSRAMVGAHRAVDIPVARVYLGQCPECDEQVVGVRPSSDDAAVECGACGGSWLWGEWREWCIGMADDAHLSVSELLGVLERNGEPITRSQLQYLCRRYGLKPQRQMRRTWMGDKAGFVLRETDCYRVGDVRELQRRVYGAQSAA